LRGKSKKTNKLRFFYVSCAVPIIVQSGGNVVVLVVVLVLVEVLVLVLVLVDVDVELLDDVVVVVGVVISSTYPSILHSASLNVISIKLIQSPVDLILTIVAPSGTVVEYPDVNVTLSTPVSKAVVYPFKLEYRLNGPVSDPATVNVNVTIIWFYFIMVHN
jgi:hypothetical protein